MLANEEQVMSSTRKVKTLIIILILTTIALCRTKVLFSSSQCLLRSMFPHGQVKSSQVKSSQVKSSQVKSSQAKPSQVKSSQFKPSQGKEDNVRKRREILNPMPEISALSQSLSLRIESIES